MSICTGVNVQPDGIVRGLPPEPKGGVRVLTIAELQSSVGKEFVGDWFRVDPIANDVFCQSTYIHDVYSENDLQAGYEADLIEGFYLLSLVDALKARVYRDDPGYYALNYGSNKLRFVEQVTLRSVLRFSCTVEHVVKKNDGYLVELSCRLNIKDVERPALVYSSIYYLLPIPSEI